MSYRSSNITATLLLITLFSSTGVFAESGGANKQPTAEAKSRSPAGDPVAGKRKAGVCFDCHGADGNSSDPMSPKLAGQYASYISKQLANYQDGRRSHDFMSGIAANIGEQDIADISAYFATQPGMKGGTPTANKRGQHLYTVGDIPKGVMTCAFCHGERGRGTPVDTGRYPVIGGQHKDYLLKQLKEFRKDDRLNSPYDIMNKTLKSLNDADLEALAAYISTL